MNSSLGYVSIVFAFALESNTDIDDYPVIRTLLLLMKGPMEKLNYALNSLEHFLARTQPMVNTCPPVDNNSPPIKAEVDNSLPIPQSPSTPPNNLTALLDPSCPIDIEDAIDIVSPPIDIEPLYDPDMDNSNTSNDHDTDSNYDPSDSDYSDFENLEGDFIEARERERGFNLTYGNIWTHSFQCTHRPFWIALIHSG